MGIRRSVRSGHSRFGVGIKPMLSSGSPDRLGTSVEVIALLLNQDRLGLARKQLEQVGCPIGNMLCTPKRNQAYLRFAP
jgi:hypothetical protein